MQGHSGSQAVKPYLFFDGRCDEALEFYQRTLGARVEQLFRFKDAPPQPEPAQEGCGPVTADMAEKVMHAEFTVGGTRLFASDGMCQGKPEFKGISLALETASDAEAEKVFAALAEGGQIQMPMGPTFFSSRFGMVADRFGVSWMITVAGAPAS
ncbi:VOC family protein [Inquilinus limosus]|uniref:VOC family protein n=1 Tax=Inquilinus limosus TaxID=171674 RepID=UPI00040542DA|nr:VOC family protein [Inquilinus limosus]